MNLHAGLERYISAKNALGIAFGAGAYVLRAFERRVGDVPMDEISEVDVREFLDCSHVAPTTWRNKYFYLFRFFQYSYARSYISGVNMPENRVYRATNHAPHIYTHSELKRLLAAVPKGLKSYKIECETMRVMLLFLYAVGATPSEALTLRQCDFDAKGKRVSIFTRKLGRARRLPIGADLTKILVAHCRRCCSRGAEQPFFQTKGGERITPETLHRNFRSILRVARISKPGGAKHQPRILDLRHTFAVHRITAFLKQKKDLNSLIPALSMYLGFVSFSTAERYLRFTPERFKYQLDLLLPTKKHSKWRDNVSLMAFLDAL